jgi:hypothetical protein
MPDPIGSVSYRDVLWADQPSDREDFRDTVTRDTRDGFYSVCGELPTVLGAAIWGDETDISNACRCAEPGTLDALLCDDLALEEVQNAATAIAQKAVEMLLSAKMKPAR